MDEVDDGDGDDKINLEHDLPPGCMYFMLKLNFFYCLESKFPSVLRKAKQQVNDEFENFGQKIFVIKNKLVRS